MNSLQNELITATKQFILEKLKEESINDLIEIAHKESINVIFSYLIERAHSNACEKGWWNEVRTFGEQIALMHSELSEALEDYRNKKGIKEIYFEDKKPCGIPIELADCVIRIMDTCGRYKIDLGKAIKMKMEYNSKRPFRHGGKVI